MGSLNDTDHIKRKQLQLNINIIYRNNFILH